MTDDQVAQGVVSTDLAAPSGVAGARVSADGEAVAAVTAGGLLYVRRRETAGWRWEQAGVPPTGERVLDAAVLAQVSGNLTAVVVGADLQTWRYESGAGGIRWTSLSGPAPDPGLAPQFGAGRLAVGTGTLAETDDVMLAVISETGQPWVRQGLGADARWERVPFEDGWVAGSSWRRRTGHSHRKRRRSCTSSRCSATPRPSSSGPFGSRPVRTGGGPGSIRRYAAQWIGWSAALDVQRA